MATLTKRATSILIPNSSSFKIKAASTNKSISEIVDSAIRQELVQDEEDLKIFEERANDPTISYEEALQELKLDDKI